MGVLVAALDRPVHALRAWLDAAAITEGPLFRGVRAGVVLDAALTDRIVSARIKQLAKRAGLDPAIFSAHEPITRMAA